MALQGIDPDLFDIADICRSEETANQFAVQNGLLPSIPGVGQLGGRPPCPKDNCTGELYQANLRGRTNIARCTKCKSKLSLKRGGFDFGGRGRITWFARIDQLGRPAVRIGTNKVLAILWLWSIQANMEQCHKMLQNHLAVTEHTLIDWFQYTRELLITKLENAPPMGGPNEIVQIDESYFRGRRKRANNQRGRLLLGDAVPPARRNYGDVVDGPWIFGMVQKRPDGLLDCRLFQVRRRDAVTLIPIIQRHVLPGTTIMSDEWAAYQGLGAFGYNHQTVNHSLHFVDPATGNNTQRIEAIWGVVKTRIMRMNRGTTRALLRGHLAEYWWRGLNPENEYCAIIEEIRQAYPL